MRPFDCDTAGLFEGYGGLTMATRQVFGGDLGWYSEIEPAACRLLEHHHPGVPNLGDITQVDWSEVPRPRRLTGGFPCQDVSAAGRRRGIRPGTRSGLWTHFAYAIDQLRPELVVIENVRGLLSAEAACELEPCPWCLGDLEQRPLRALGAVLGDLASLGYDAQWVGLRAADVGAPHGRYRIFIAATPEDADSAARCERRLAAPRQAPGGWSRSHSGGRGGAPAADAGSVGRGSGADGGVGRDATVRSEACEDVDDGGRPAAHADGPGLQGCGIRGRTGAAVERDGAPAAANTRGNGREGHPERHLGAEAGQQASLGGAAAGRVLDWGSYGPAVNRWERILGRVAPAPTQVGKRGGQQLSPAFVEWMMGLPSGHVTAVPGLSRNEQLKLLGNGVVVQQAASALIHLLASSEAVAA